VEESEAKSDHGVITLTWNFGNPLHQIGCMYIRR